MPCDIFQEKHTRIYETWNKLKKNGILNFNCHLMRFIGGLQLKVNDRRPASARGLISFPRIGRSDSEMIIFPRSERSFGLILKPRNGRSDTSRNFGHLNQNHHSIPDIDIDLYALPNPNFVTSSDLDYEGMYKYLTVIERD